MKKVFINFSILLALGFLSISACTGFKPGVPLTGGEGAVIPTPTPAPTPTPSPVACSVLPPTCDSKATLTWTLPTKNEDGSDLVDLAGFKIYYGTTSQLYPNVVDIAVPTAITYDILALSSGSYYFSMTAYNVAGVESRKIGEVSLCLNTACTPTTAAISRVALGGVKNFTGTSVEKTWFKVE